ncbi:MAG: DUF5666 domain-containing protein [Candidatus Pacebacteria bacterium]|nr:DUF5666 domain-containing protein [Candidatus Paceibacterota bacterium]
MIHIKKYKVHIIWGAGVVLALLVGIFLGRATGGMRSLPGGYAMGGAGLSARGTSSTRTGGAGGGFVTGEVTSIDGSNITLQLPNGNSEVVLYSSSTPVTEPTTVTVSKLTVGTRIMVGGSANADGSMTAQTIQIASGNNAGRGAPSSTYPQR